MRVCLPAAILLLCSATSAAAADGVHPVLLSGERIATLRARVDRKIEPTYSAYQSLQSEADRDRKRQPQVATEWYVPGYYRDAAGHRRAKMGLKDDANAVYRLGLVYCITGEERYAEAAVRLIDAWSAGVESTSTKDDSTLSFSYHFPAMVFGAALVRHSPRFTAPEQARFERFLREKALPLNTMDRANNWGNWGLVLVLGIAAYLDDQPLVDRAGVRWRELIDRQIDQRGHLPHEVKRNEGRSGIWYSHFSLMPQTIAAEILRVRGIDLYDHVSPQGRSLRLAYETLVPWVESPATFPYWQGEADRLHGVTYYSYFEILAARWPNQAAQRLLEKRRPMSAEHSAPVLTFTHGDLLRDN